MNACFACLQPGADLSLWGHPICRTCAARLGLHVPAPGSQRREPVPGLADELDALLAIWIAQAMLDDPDTQEVST